MRYRGDNFVENSVNEGCRGWDLKDIAGDSLSTPSVLKIVQLSISEYSNNFRLTKFIQNNIIIYITNRSIM
jgi:hypothetical protein